VIAKYIVMVRASAMRQVVLAALALLVLALPASASASRACGIVKTSRYSSAPAEVTVSKGKTSCAEARKIATKFQSRNRGPMHGTDLAEGYWLVYGWKCQDGTDGGSGCMHGKLNAITMQAKLPSATIRRECEAEGAEHGRAGEEACYDENAQERKEAARVREGTRETLAEEQARNKQECDEDVCVNT
jgi:hypothetical protein